MSTTRTTPPAGWELDIDFPDYSNEGFPEGYNMFLGMADNYESERRTKDGETFVYGYWNAKDGLGLVVSQDGHEITLPSPWAARKLSELLWQIAAEAEQ